MIISRSDVLSKLLPNTVDEITKFDSLATWKFAMIRLSSKVVFIKPSDSRYVLASTKIDEDSELIGIWCTEENSGISTSVDLIGLKTLMLVVIPPVQLSIYNTAVFDKVLSPSKIIEERGFEILCRLTTSKEHSNKSPKELVIKALQLSSEYQQQYSALVAFLSEHSQ